MLFRSRGGLCGVSSGTRGVFAGDGWGSANVIDYITIATTGNAISFGAEPSQNSMAAGASGI